MTLEEAKTYLRENVEDGAKCPCCGQLAKVYKRAITGSSAAWLCSLYRAAPDGRFVHVSNIDHGQPSEIGGDAAKLSYWGLIEEMPKDPLDTKKRTSGFWRITSLGIKFVRGDATVPKHVRLYDGRLLGFVDADNRVTIRQALGTKFDYARLMAS